MRAPRGAHEGVLRRLTESSMAALEGCTDDMCTMILPEECWERALNLGVSDATECSINGGAVSWKPTS